MPETATGPEQHDLQPEHEQPEPELEEPSPRRPRLEGRVWPKGSTPAWAAAAGWGTAEQQEAGAAQTPTGK
eukprot:COSAG04_NODE_15138_length_542_cov_1.027088_1_plen_71_part_00